MRTLAPNDAAAANVASATEPEPSSDGIAESDKDNDDLICTIRQLFRGAEIRTSQDLITAMEASSGSSNEPDERSREEYDNIIRAAIRRRILELVMAALALLTKRFDLR